MLQQFFLIINSWMTAGTSIAALGCFLWGMVSVLFSPCHLASIPLIVAYVGGQRTAVRPRKAIVLATAFTLGLFLSIAIIGIVCALLGRMLGDVGNYWQILVGIVLVWVALGMLGVEKCSFSGGLLYRLNLRGISGALGLGLGYGVLSGSCTFGFIAPILALITVQQQAATGTLYILLFALGHCLPIVIAGSSTAAVRRVVENTAWRGAAGVFRKGAGVVIAGLGLFFIINPLILY